METNIVTYIQKERSVLDIFNNNNHYGLLQTRKSQHAEWKTYIIEIEETIYHTADYVRNLTKKSKPLFLDNVV